MNRFIDGFVLPMAKKKFTERTGMFNWFRRLFRSGTSNPPTVPKKRPSGPWTERGMRELSQGSSELDKFQNETAELLCALVDTYAAMPG